MAIYTISITRHAQKELAKLPKKDLEKITNAVENLAKNPRPLKSKKLSGREGWRIRIGDYRVIYLIEDNNLIIIVVEIGHRKEVYK